MLTTSRGRPPPAPRSAGGSHTPAWALALFPGAAATVSRADFDTRLSAMPFTNAMGPKGTVKEAELPAQALDALWAFLCDGDAQCAELSATAMLKRLQSLSLLEGIERAGAIGLGPDSIVWNEFAKGFGAAPFERF